MTDFSEIILISVVRVLEDLKFLDPEKAGNSPTHLELFTSLASYARRYDGADAPS